MEKIGIIGGGASALMCACFAKNKNITIIEKSEKFGKKILATGNGRCNLTNNNMNKYSYNRNIDKYLKKFTSSDAINFFNKIGLEIYHDEEGRVYPISNSANSVLDVLRNHLNGKQNITIETEKDVIDIEKFENNYKIIYKNGNFDFFDKIIVASGNNTNLSIFDKFNVKYKPFAPSLCALLTEKHKHLAGVRVKNVLVKCNFLNYEFKEIGEVLFRDDGISGIVIFNLSAHMARSNNYNRKIVIDFLPDVEINNLKAQLQNRRNNLFKLESKEFLTGLFHKAINSELLSKCKIDSNKLVKDISDKEIEKLCGLIKNYELNSKGYCDNNQVMSGGILLSELTETLESKENKGMFFIGEVIDVDGVCGGYNLQWAWTSGKIVGECL